MKITISRRIALLITALFLALTTYAQTSTVSGIVLDQSGSPVIGAAVMVKGTSHGAVTDTNGAYSLQTADNAILVCQFIGYKNVETAVEGRSRIDFTLEEDSLLLDATVVVGYGTLKKTQLVGSVENLSGEVIEDRPNAHIAKSLQGEIAGLNITQVDGKANHSGKIYIRGNATSYYSRKNFSATDGASGSSHSIGSGGGALVLIDGVEGDLSSVNPADVETVAVLKDASSAAIYGAKGCNGVILVTTKTAKGDDSFSVSYSGSYSINTRTVKWEDGVVNDAIQWTEAFYEFWDGDKHVPGGGYTLPSAILTYNIGSDYLDRLRTRRITGNSNVYDMYNGQYAYYDNVNWLSQFYKRWHGSTTHDISVKGASKKIKYSLSGRFYNQDGVYKIGNDDYQTYNIRSKISLDVTKWLTIDNNTSLFRSKQSQAMNSNETILGQMLEKYGQPIFPAYNEDGTYTVVSAQNGFSDYISGNTGQNVKNLDITTQTGITINFIKDVLKLRGELSYRAIRREQERFRAPSSYMFGPDPSTQKAWVFTAEQAYKSHWGNDTDYIKSDVVLTWTPKLSQNHSLNVVAGWNLESNKYTALYLQMKNSVYPDLHDSFEMYTNKATSNATTQSDSNYNMMGFFGRVNYTLFNRYIFEFSARGDGSSKFPTKQQWGFFPSGSIGWRVSEEPWMAPTRKWLDNFKIRANAGSMGNGRIAPYYFLETMGVSQSSVLVDGAYISYTNVPSPIPSSLTWETVTTYDVGLDLDFLKSRLSFSGDYYIKNTTDLIVPSSDPDPVYGAGAPQENCGSLQTKGWELTLSWRDSFKLAGKDFIYSLKGSVWDTRTWVTEYKTVTNKVLGYYTGKEIGEIWGFHTAGIFRDNDEANNWATDTYHKNGSNFREYAGDLRFVDMNADGDISYGKETLEDHGDLDIIGNFTPRYQYGVNLDFRWNGIGLSLFFQGVGKRDWFPSVETGFFYGGYNRPYSYLMTSQTGDNYAHVDYDTDPLNWTVTNYDANPYWTRRVGYCANRNAGPLTVDNDHYLQNAAYVRLKNLTVDYTLPLEITRKAKIERLRLYVSMENLWTWSPMFKYTQMFDPEVIGTGDSDLDSASKFGLQGVGDGYSYPMLKTFTFGVNISF